MDNLVEQINACEYLNLQTAEDGDGNTLRLVVEEAKPAAYSDDLVVSGHIIRDVTPIETDDSCAVFELQFGSYIAYSVRNESYTTWDETEKFEGDKLRVYSNSKFLDYVRQTTFADDTWPGGALVHYGIVCGDHIVDVVSPKLPEINRLR